MARETFAGRMARDGYTAGFDYLRIGLAFSVVLWHSVVASGNFTAAAIAEGPVLGPFLTLVLPMFFALSGFLVSGSLDRSKRVSGFVTLRVIRLVPALAVEVLLSALILGPLVTTSTLAQYFTDRRFFAYFGNIVGRIRYNLPGVFETNPDAGMVNISLWTVPYELECYLALVGIALFGIFRRPKMFALITIGLIVLASIHTLAETSGAGRTGVFYNRTLVLAFLCGNLLYLYRSHIPLSPTLALASFVMCFAMLSFGPTAQLSVLPAAYITVYLGLQNPPRIMGGDYSYGVYLFGFPLQQLIASFPTLRPWWVIFLLTVPLSLAYAAFSWHCVEKPVLDRKKRIVATVDRVVDRVRAGAATFRRSLFKAAKPMPSANPVADGAEKIDASQSA